MTQIITPEDKDDGHLDQSMNQNDQEPSVDDDNGLEIEPDSDGEDAENSVDATPFSPADIDVAIISMNLDTLIRRIRNDEIDMDTDFQRHAELWSHSTMSRLIESILVRLPLPSFYFDGSNDDKWLIVDGLQRLTTLKKFVVDQSFALKDLEFLKELNGKKFNEFERLYIRRIEECQVTVHLIKPGSPPEVKFSAFRRINTGGLMLNNQEIRHAMATTEIREVLERLIKLPVSIGLMGDLSKRMKAQELVLRFWAFYCFNYLDKKNKKELASFIDKALEDIRDSSQLSSLEETYTKAIGRCEVLLGEFAFVKIRQKNGKKKINSTLFELWMVSLAGLSDESFQYLCQHNILAFQNDANELLNNTDFSEAISSSTQIVKHVETRYTKVDELLARHIQGYIEWSNGQAQYISNDGISSLNECIAYLFNPSGETFQND